MTQAAHLTIKPFVVLCALAQLQEPSVPAVAQMPQLHNWPSLPFKKQNKTKQNGPHPRGTPGAGASQGPDPTPPRPGLEQGGHGGCDDGVGVLQLWGGDVGPAGGSGRGPAPQPPLAGGRGGGAWGTAGPGYSPRAVPEVSGPQR